MARRRRGPRPRRGVRPGRPVGQAAVLAGGRGRIAVAVAAFLVALAIGWQQARGTGGGLNPYDRTRESEDVFAVGGEVFEFPPPPSDPSAERLDPAPVVDPAGGAYEVLQVDEDGQPARYDPCRPLPIVVNERTAPPGGTRLVEEAIEEVRRATGLRLVVERPTDEAPSTHRRPVQDRYGDRWAPVLLAWTDASEVDDLAGDVAGVGVSTAMRRDGSPLTYVTGVVLLDGPDLARTLTADGGWEAARAVLMHELGHLVGLGHVDAVGEVMHPEGGGATAFGPGDQAGLALLGSGPCVPGL